MSIIQNFFLKVSNVVVCVLSCSGLISVEEFRHTWRLFSAHLGVDINDKAIDDLARSIDFNKDGSIDFTEFLEAFRVVHKLDNKDQQLNGKVDGDKYS